MKRQIIRFFGVVIGCVCGIFTRQGLAYDGTYDNAYYDKERYPVTYYIVPAAQVPNMPGGSSAATSYGWQHKGCLNKDTTFKIGDLYNINLLKNDFYIDDNGGTGWNPNISGRPYSCTQELKSECAGTEYASGRSGICANSHYLCNYIKDNTKVFMYACGSFMHSDGAGHATSSMLNCWCGDSGIYVYDHKVLDWLGGCSGSSGSNCKFYYYAIDVTNTQSEYTDYTYVFKQCTSGHYKTASNLETRKTSYNNFAGYCKSCPAPSSSNPAGLIASTAKTSAGTLITSCKVNGDFSDSAGTYTYDNGCTYKN